LPNSSRPILTWLFCLSEAFSARALDLEPVKDLRLSCSALVSCCFQSLGSGLAPRSAPPHSDLVPGLSALTSGSLSSSRRSPRDSRTSQPSRRVNPKSRLGKSARRLSPPPGIRTRRQRPVSQATRRCPVRTELDRLTTVTLSSTTFFPSAPLAEESLPKKRLSPGRVDPFRRRNLRLGLVPGRSLVQSAIPTLLLTDPDSQPESCDPKLAPCRSCCVSSRLPTY